MNQYYYITASEYPNSFKTYSAMLHTLGLFAILFAIFAILYAFFYAILTNFICTKFPSLMISVIEHFCFVSANRITSPYSTSPATNLPSNLLPLDTRRAPRSSNRTTTTRMSRTSKDIHSWRKKMVARNIRIMNNFQNSILSAKPKKTRNLWFPSI